MSTTTTITTNTTTTTTTTTTTKTEKRMNNNQNIYAPIYLREEEGLFLNLFDTKIFFYFYHQLII